MIIMRDAITGQDVQMPETAFMTSMAWSSGRYSGLKYANRADFEEHGYRDGLGLAELYAYGELWYVYRGGRRN